MDNIFPHSLVSTSGGAFIRTHTIEDIPKINWDEVDKFQKWRGEVVSQAILVEQQIEEIISKIFFNKNVDLVDNFRSFILGRDFFTFMNKWHVLKDILDTMEPYKNEDYKELKRELHDIVNIRNNFAHGKAVHYNGEIILEYFREGINKDKIDENTIINFRSLCKKCLGKLDIILADLNNQNGK